MKNNIDYYQHYASADQHPKFKMLRVIYGWSGEGRFWALNNRIAQAENCCLDISKKYNAASIASDLGQTIQEFQEFIDCLKNDCELIDECEPGVITTDIIQENFQSVSTNREKARERKKRYLEKVSKGSPELSESLPEQNKRVKERKGKESKYILPEGSSSKLEVSTPICPHEKIRLLYNEILPELPTCTIRNKTFDQHTRARWGEDKTRQNLEWWENLFKDIRNSDFLMGRSKTNFRASLDWIVKTQSMTKILNGNYKNKNDNHNGFKEKIYVGTPESEISWMQD